ATDTTARAVDRVVLRQLTLASPSPTRIPAGRDSSAVTLRSTPPARRRHTPCTQREGCEPSTTGEDNHHAGRSEQEARAPVRAHQGVLSGPRRLEGRGGGACGAHR